MNNLQSKVADASKFMQHPSDGSSGYVRSTACGGGGEYLSSCKAFTLSEVLITLGIIGVVAALIIPNFLAKTFERESVEKFKQTFSIIDNALRAMQASEGCEGGECFEIAAPAISPITDKVEKNFKFTDKYCKQAGQASKQVSWLPKDGYALDGTVTKYATLVTGYDTTSDNSDICIYRLNNGSSVTFSRMNAFANTGVLNIVIDVNGKNGPNRVGKDVFPVSANYYGIGLSPYYHIHIWASQNFIKGLCNNAQDTCQSDETSPGAYVLTNGKLPDLTKLGYPSHP